MPQLIAHLFGDYILQNHWMALNKTKSSIACGLHVLLYTLPFLFLAQSVLALSVIAGTHFVIDRWSLAKRWPAFWGVGEPGWVMTQIREWRANQAKGPAGGGKWARDARVAFIAANPLPDPAPPFLAVWLAIIADNTFHLLINYLALRYAA